MEITKEGGKMGLIKVGKKVELAKALKGRTLMDGLIRINVVPRAKAASWVSQSVIICTCTINPSLGLDSDDAADWRAEKSIGKMR